jgi:hypothetical protein
MSGNLETGGRARGSSGRADKDERLGLSYVEEENP